MKIEVTKRQLEAIINLTDSMSGMIGTGNDFDDHQKEIKIIDRMLKKNGYKRTFN